MSIRLAQEKDLAQILAIYSPYVENTTVTFEYEIPSPADFQQRFLSVTSQFPWLIWEEKGLILGYAYACAPFSRAAYGWCAEPSIYLHPDARRRGIGKRLYRALETLLQLQGYRLSYAIITSENEASLAFHRHMGYTHLAHFPDCAYKHGRCLGIAWMQKRLNSTDLPSNPPIAFPVFVQNNKNLPEILAKLSLS